MEAAGLVTRARPPMPGEHETAWCSSLVGLEGASRPVMFAYQQRHYVAGLKAMPAMHERQPGASREKVWT